jgi:hypothetical protein
MERSDKIRIERDRPKKKNGGTPGTGKPNGGASRPVIRIVAGEIPRMTDEAERALIGAGAAIYSRSSVLVRPITDIVPASDKRTTQTAKLKALSRENMAEALSLAAEFQRFNIRKDDWVVTDPPDTVVALLLAREGQWRLPRIAGVITTPTLRHDGSLLSEPGYDPETHLYLTVNEELHMPAIPERPSRAEAERALQLLSDVLTGFPFVGPIDRAVALSCLMTPTLRGALMTAPLHAINAPTPGTGKSFLIDLASTIATGRLCPVIAAGKTEEETEKRLGSLLIAGVSIVSIDNISEPIGGDFICQFTERPLVHCRILGRSEAPEFESRSTIFVNGNNLRIRGDMTRRGVLCRLDAEMERPETRRFPFNPIQRVLADRGIYVAAILTIARAYKVAGSPEVCGPIASYEQWSELVRAPLIWLGEPDPVASIETIRAEDPERANLIEVIANWHEHLGLNTPYAAHKVITKACEKRETYSGLGDFIRPEFRDVLLRVAGAGGTVSSKMLGHWLTGVKGLPVGGYKFLVKNDPKDGNRYSLVPASVGGVLGVTE